VVAKEYGSMPMYRAHINFTSEESESLKFIIGGIVAYAIYCTPFELIVI
jgi:hypothetical protein